jgi:hypothetical protein
MTVFTKRAVGKPSMNGSIVLRIEVTEEEARLFKAYCALIGKSMSEQLIELFTEAISKDGRISLPAQKAA